MKAKRWYGILTLLIAIAAVPLITCTIAKAQASDGRIRGVVTDQGGAPVANAEITATQISTNRTVTTTSSDSGVYLIENLTIGDYRVEVQKQGFKRLSREPVNVATGSSTTYDIALELGGVSEIVEVNESLSPLKQTDNAELSTVLENRVLFDLPLSLGNASANSASGRRQIENFVFLTPGVTGNQFSKFFNGSPDLSQESIIDGIPHAVPVTPGFIAQTSPPFEAVEEFKVANSLYPAEYGRGFGLTIYTLKSGTNGFHGNVFEFVRNDKFDARGFFSATRPIVRQNEFGFTLGGPIIKDKTFFFGSYSGFRRRGGAPNRNLVTLPTTAFRQGDFSALLPLGIVIYDPSTTRSDGRGGFVRDPFPGNIIPANRISTVAKNVTAILPVPDFSGVANNYVSRSTNPTNDDIWSLKINHSFNDSHKISYTQWGTNLDGPVIGDLGGNELDNGFNSVTKGGGIRVNYDWIISPTVLNHVAFGYSRADPTRQLDTRQGVSNIGLLGVPTDAPGYPTFNIAGLPPLGNSTQQPNDPSNSQSYIINDSLSFVRGKHQFKFGGEYWYQSYTNFNGTNAGGIAGSLNFSNLETSQPNSANFGTQGYAYASFLLGQVDSAQRFIGDPGRKFDLKYLSFFIDDKWQVNKKLTLSLGLRYEIPFSYSDVGGTMSGLDLSAPNPGAGGRLGAYVFGSDKITPPLDKKEFGPRLGVAYQLNGKTVIRGGYGLIYAQTNGSGLGSWQLGNAFLLGYTDVSNLTSLNSGITPAFVLDQGFPAFTNTLPRLDPSIANGGLADYMDPTGGRQSYAHNYQVSIQRDLPYGLFLDLAYVGIAGRRLPSNLNNINQVPAQYLSLGSLLNQSYNSPAAIAAGITAPYAGFTGTVAQSLRPFPQYTSINNAVQPIGKSDYNAMQVKVQKRFSQGLSFLVSYTLSKTLTDTSQSGFAAFNAGARDVARPELERGLASNDRTHYLSNSLVYELPFGKDLNGVAGAFVKGFEVTAVTTYSSGTPISISGGGPLPLFGGGNRPNRVAGQNVLTNASNFDPATSVYLNANAFAQPAAFTYGNGANVEPNVRGFGYFNEDFSVIKRFNINWPTQESNLQVRWEIFNIFNRTTFSNPSSAFNNLTTFGRVSGQANTPRNMQFAIKFNF